MYHGGVIHAVKMLGLQENESTVRANKIITKDKSYLRTKHLVKCSFHPQ